MALLLDTQIILWIEESPSKIAAPAIERIAEESVIYFSTVSVWEVAIKLKTGKLKLKQPLPDFVQNFQNGYRFKLLEASLQHIYHTQQLPLHHRDPFDRLLIAQALAENIPVISSDAAWDAYGVARIWS